MPRISKEKLEKYAWDLQERSMHDINQSSKFIQKLIDEKPKVLCRWGNLISATLHSRKQTIITTLIDNVKEKLRTKYLNNKKYGYKNIDVIMEILSKRYTDPCKALEANCKVLRLLEEDGYYIKGGYLTRMHGWMWGIYETSDYMNKAL